MGGGGQDSYFHLAWGRTWVRLPVESLPTSHSPLAEMLQSHFIKKPKLMGLDLGSHCLGPSPISGNEGTTLGGSQSCAGWARESENRKVARAPATDCLSECHRVRANSSLTRGTRAVGLKRGGARCPNTLPPHSAGQQALLLGQQGHSNPHRVSEVEQPQELLASGPGSRNSWERLT